MFHDKQFMAFLSVQHATGLVIDGVIDALESKNNRRGIPIYLSSTKEGVGRKHRIKERDGKDILTVYKMMGNMIGGVSALETSTLKVYRKSNVKVVLSERDAAGHWNETIDFLRN